MQDKQQLNRLAEAQDSCVQDRCTQRGNQRLPGAAGGIWLKWGEGDGLTESLK